MRKWLTNITVALTISSSALPLTGCTFNFYVKTVREKVAENLATQTSSVIKSLIVSKELNADTRTTINDSLNIGTESAIQNHTNNTSINNWNEFQSNWGYQGKINTSGFDGNSFIVPDGKGSLTNKVNSLKSTNETLSYLTYITALNVIDNQTLHGVLLGKNAIAKPIINDFLIALKEKSLPDPWNQFVDNLINNYQSNFLTPITNILNELIDGWNEVTDPNNLKSYMEGFKDANDIPYSQWVNEKDSWFLKPEYYQNWNKNDINLYRGGTFLNYLFKKIGEDNAGVNSKYLGETVSSAIISASIGGKDIGEEVLKALQPYIDLLLSNPKYILLIVNALIPLIKELIFNAPDLTQGIKNLTFGNEYPTNKEKNSYNLKEVFYDLKNILNNKEKTKNLVKHLLNSPILYDIKLMIIVVINEPLPVALDMLDEQGRLNKEDLVNTVADLLTGDTVMPIFNDIYNIIEKLNDQFKGSDGIDLNLEALKNLLINDNTGLLVLLQEVADTIANIIKPNPEEDNQKDEITDEQLEALYESLGGQSPKNGVTPINFKTDSILWILKNQLSDKNSDLSNLVKVITRDDQYQGVANIITEQNETWIKENYTNYISPNYSKSKISKINYKASENNTERIIHLSYTFSYEVNSVKYNFLIEGIAIDSKDNFMGTHNFKFTKIQNLN